MRSTEIKKLLQFKSIDMFTSYGHIIKPTNNHRIFDDFRPGNVPLTCSYLMVYYVLLLFITICICMAIKYRLCYVKTVWIE